MPADTVTASTAPFASVSSEPYKITPVFSETSLPAALRKAHSTKAGVWGVIRVVDGRLDYIIEATGKVYALDPCTPGLVLPEQEHHVAPVGPMKMRVEFHHALPSEFAVRPEISSSSRGDCHSI